ncbi:hypothetical protein TNCV_3120431 [Trichonephila clavipes]|uniref:Uncharacterized protein n=1 Tax=Trichonephila clavipes TaxID=2585209 RepID=A0A8X6W9Q2_TRICX|nr:hypothetical protein TNCV_3120431 [Trichonephila clavipes]
MDSEKVVWASQIWCSAFAGQCETTLGNCNAKPQCNFWLGVPRPRGSLVYADKPQTLDHLEDNIRLVIADIRPQMLEKVIENWMTKLDYIRASRGSHMPEIIFKM